MARVSKGDEPVVDSTQSDAPPNPVWFKPIMIGFMLLGLAWIIVFYLSLQAFPIPGIGGWNLVIGFGIAFIGFLMTTRWR
ncbi:MAG: cell division protein CrgA [Microbacterium sp.]|uniref:cell division protein CrgA n=1 Tax=Microbacterium sp. TaxID=51671 RepID=UPI0039E369E0